VLPRLQVKIARKCTAVVLALKDESHVHARIAQRQAYVQDESVRVADFSSDNRSMHPPAGPCLLADAALERASARNVAGVPAFRAAVFKGPSLTALGHAAARL